MIYSHLLVAFPVSLDAIKCYRHHILGYFYLCHYIQNPDMPTSYKTSYYPTIFNDCNSVER